MKALLYWKLAADGIRKNQKLYFPYILTCIGMVMMAYILQSLSYCPALRNMKGGSSVETVLSLGKIVIVIFSVLFLLYSNSFLIRRRYREFGLYNVLGMGKRALGRVILSESVMVAAVSLLLGLGLGILFSKLAELGLVNAVHAEADFSFTISGECVRIILLFFLPVFGLLGAKALIQVRRADPLALMRSEAAGEKPPKANYLLAIGGLALLAGAYAMAVNIRNPMTALVLFFVAVVMVILATYLLCISGSVTLCRFLQGRKRFYYRKERFVSISTMVYRMKRNGAGLASICILSTMVLVMLTSTSSLYFGAEDSITSRCPNDAGMAIKVPGIDCAGLSQMEQIHDGFQALFETEQVAPDHVQLYRYASIAGLLTEDSCEPDHTAVAFRALELYDAVREIFFIPLEDYNAYTGAGITLEPGQAMVEGLRCHYDRGTFRMGAVELDIVGTLPQQLPIGEAVAYATPVLFLVVPDFEELRPLDRLADYRGNRMLNVSIYFGCDLPGMTDRGITDLFEKMTHKIRSGRLLSDGRECYTVSLCRTEHRRDFYSLYGGLFFLGILLSILFLSAAALIIYYKQICEGYEDQARYAILRKVGMTREDIRRNVNSQIQTVFFIPLILAGIHLCFAFPMVWQLLKLFNLQDMGLAIRVNILVFLLFCLFYGIIYKFTAGANYGIVSSGKSE